MFKFMAPIIATTGIMMGIVKALFLSVVSGKTINPPVVRKNYVRGLVTGILITMLLAAGTVVALIIMKRHKCLCDEMDNCSCDEGCCVTADGFEDDCDCCHNTDNAAGQELDS